MDCVDDNDNDRAEEVKLRYRKKRNRETQQSTKPNHATRCMCVDFGWVMHTGHSHSNERLFWIYNFLLWLFYIVRISNCPFIIAISIPAELLWFMVNSLCIDQLKCKMKVSQFVNENYRYATANIYYLSFCFFFFIFVMVLWHHHHCW